MPFNGSLPNVLFKLNFQIRCLLYIKNKFFKGIKTKDKKF
jgi:hypothetical protein